MTEKVSPPLGRRPTKFTPERIQLIKNLVARGTSRDEIAKTLDVTLGSLQVTCSKLGISLRRPVSEKAVPRLVGSSSGVATVCGDTTSPQVTPEEVVTDEAQSLVNFAVTIRYKDEERVTELGLTPAMIAQLAAEAHLQNMRIHELVGELITATLKKNLVQQVLDSNKAATA